MTDDNENIYKTNLDQTPKVANVDKANQSTNENIYTESVVIDRRSTVEELKKKIAEQLNEKIEYVIFRRGGAHGAELVEDELNFKTANVYNMMSIYIERGEPTRVGYKRIRFYLAEYYNPDWNSLAEAEKNPKGLPENFRKPHDHEFTTFTELFKQPIRTLDKVKLVKEKILPQLRETYPQHFSGEKITIRMREKLSDKLCQVYQDEKILEAYSMHDDKEIAIQVVTDPL